MPSSIGISLSGFVRAGHRPLAGIRPIVLKNPIADRPGVLAVLAFVAVDEARGASGGHDWRLNGDQLGEFAEVLGGGGEEELVAGAARTS